MQKVNQEYFYSEDEMMDYKTSFYKRIECLKEKEELIFLTAAKQDNNNKAIKNVLLYMKYIHS